MVQEYIPLVPMTCVSHEMTCVAVVGTGVGDGVTCVPGEVHPEIITKKTQRTRLRK